VATDGGGSGSEDSDGAAGSANTGGGGGGGGFTDTMYAGGVGGSGVVIFTLPIQSVVTFSGGVTQSSAAVGLNRVYTVTATSTTDETVTIS